MNEDHTARQVKQLLHQIEGQDHTNGLREGLLETPARVAKAYEHWFGGYQRDVGELLKVFKDGGEGYNEMVVVGNIQFYSTCEHHMAPIMGMATVGYIPNGSIVGLSKMHRLVDAFARRLQVQERMTVQIADAMEEHLAPHGVGVVLQARHLCIESRGVCQRGSITTTSALRGVMQTSTRARQEFLGFVAPNPLL